MSKRGQSRFSHDKFIKEREEKTKWVEKRVKECLKLLKGK
jgi:hypothetical protein